MSGRKCEFVGIFRMMPVTLKSQRLSPLRTFPNASSAPKYLEAISSEITTEYGSVSAVRGFPATSGMANRSSRGASAQMTFLS